MEYINNFVITLVAYIKFVLGLILISVMINPIVKFFTGGEQELVSAIKSYENMFYESTSIENKTNISESKIESFKNNLNNNCDKLLKEEFSGREFKSNVKCEIDLENMEYKVDGVEVGVKNSEIKLIDNIKININEESEEAVSNEEVIENGEEIKNYLSEVFKISTEKIKLYSMGR